jgi:hypothetical protein
MQFTGFIVSQFLPLPVGLVIDEPKAGYLMGAIPSSDKWCGSDMYDAQTIWKSHFLLPPRQFTAGRLLSL